MPLFRKDLPSFPPNPLDAPPEGERLHLNEAAEDWPEGAREELLARLRELPFRFYPESEGRVAAKLAARLGIEPASVLLTPSASVGLDLVAMAGLDPGDEVAVPEVGFALVPLILARHRARARKVPLGTGFPLGAWRAAAGVRQLWIPLPVNPTGAWISPAELSPLLREIEARPDPPLVLLDEAYSDFAPESHLRAPFERGNVLLLRSFSKGLCSAGWRLGALIGRPELIDGLRLVDNVFTIPTPALVALEVALEFAEDFAAIARRTADRRDRVRAELLRLGFEVPESAGNFLFVAPDPAGRLAGSGLAIRSLGGLSAARVTIGSEVAMAKLVAALGGSLATG